MSTNRPHDSPSRPAVKSQVRYNDKAFGTLQAAGHAFVQNFRRGHYDIAAEAPSRHMLRVAFDDLALAL